MKKVLIFITLLTSTILFQSCNWLTPDNIDQALGWLAEDEDTANIEDDVNLGFTLNSENLPSVVDLKPYFPPIGDQGDYGTCVAWAVGYNHKSFLEAKENGDTYYSDPNKIFSPKDLFWSVDNSKKGENCNGTNFEYAYDVILNRGIATINTVPYDNLGDCSQAPPNSWTTNATKHKISNYREIEVNKKVIKSYLAAGRAVVFGAKLGDQFMNYTDGVLSYLDYGYTGQHAYHAMILSGYDDSKGPNGAFRVVNSWGTSWGDNGCAWVDEDFFCGGDFAFCAFVATDILTNPDQNGDNVVDDPTSGYDVVAWQLTDEDLNDYVNYPSQSDDPRWRTSYYNVYNAGDNTLKASDDWSIMYILYNAYDGNDYRVILFDYYSDDYGNFGENGDLSNATEITSQIPAQGYWWNNVNVASGQSVSQAVFNNTNPFNWSYYMPDVTGYYYLLIYADAFNTFSESDESNNFAYYSQKNGDPIYIVNGIMQNAPVKKLVLDKGVPSKNQQTDMETVRNKHNLNAYTTTEIQDKIMHDRKTGLLQKKVMEYYNNQKTLPKKIYAK